MSLIPAFKLGLWNAWILTIWVLAIIVTSQIIMKRRDGHLEKVAQMTKKENRLSNILMVIMITSLIYSFFLPLKLSEVWFYTGLIIYLLALIVSLIALQNFATAQKDKPITKGIYSFSRNPMYLSGFIAYIGISIASASWIFLLSGIVYIILQHVLTDSEERFCLKKYGNSYQKYKNRTPRWIGLHKSNKND